jgi:hypothetical protein
MAAYSFLPILADPYKTAHSISSFGIQLGKVPKQSRYGFTSVCAFINT